MKKDPLAPPEVRYLKASYIKDTKRKHRYSADDKEVSVGIYITKGTSIPDQLVIQLKETK
jgi:hypothetical protein